MKNILVKLLSVASLVLIMGCNKSENTGSNSSQTSTSEDTKYSRILFEETVYDFGNIKQGEVVKHTFAFKNDGDEPLIISNASASCGCTVPEWPKDPVKPGDKGVITVQFNSTGKSGTQNKTVIITANTLPNTTTLILKGEVEAPAIENNNQPK